MKTTAQRREEERRANTKYRTLYNVSYITPSGLRMLFGSNQGCHMYETRESAEKFLEALLKNTGEDRLAATVGEQARGTFRVDDFLCYEHGDAVGIYVHENRCSFFDRLPALRCANFRKAGSEYCEVHHD